MADKRQSLANPNYKGDDYEIDTAIENFQELDLLILNAGVNAHFVFDDQEDLEIFNQVMQVNFFGYLYPTK